ncbi:bifunctional 2-C-methyl-D-erythritol 4-phosphate cytidylyltransferase/2-C-methyl-D-erythritol 2,4-cyclodiphosphate synthase [uncultured Boseongicola sp.]|uniref:bifunctional 2-C-methyl-D-erythritol 4-phosphate cytidylyltransferase/2-C-methyl-D-erythritol 2,4-cyclodiphosphate synthase n=1 Tax=uncultured Boseongicola sp. TaxID=1648499 RepID=UPI002627DC5E|nr:bifunctional 2-C-methyl-D-erythritol 4-phosphate cytidylyltransferase/2-C-methyl-D-erythritol 2,4-cyclodiphosphate synthase [uncultured Boseongicola sp.]
MSVGAVIVAAGRGTRAGGGLPKQWRPLAGATVASHTLAAFTSHPLIDSIVIVVHPDDIATDLWPADTGGAIVAGGETRTASVRAGLAALAGRVDHVLIHDVARPLISHAVIDRVIAALKSSDAAAPAIAVTDALWHGKDNTVVGTQDRTGVYRAQTPQGFDLAKIIAAHETANADAADDVEIARLAGITVTIVEGDPANVKITGPEDFNRAERLLQERSETPMDIRVGNGFDVHRFGSGDHVILCGVTIPHSRGLQGHSDADVGLHTITDAIYGALSEGDIGRHFPPTDPQWKGAASGTFLTHAADLAASRGFRISNIDCTLICEFPKIAPHAADMQKEVARITNTEPSRISVKATTSEKLGFPGRGEGIACMATVTLIAP